MALTSANPGRRRERRGTAGRGAAPPVALHRRGALPRGTARRAPRSARTRVPPLAVEKGGYEKGYEKGFSEVMSGQSIPRRSYEHTHARKSIFQPEHALWSWMPYGISGAVSANCRMSIMQLVL